MTLVGYCMGGLLSTICMALHANGPVRNLAVFTTPIDFTKMKLFSKWGLGQTLTREVFAIALDMELEKLMAQMTVDQRGAINVFEGLGFRAEALLKDHVKDRDGKKHDIVILSHDVARFETQMAAYGVTAAL